MAIGEGKVLGLPKCHHRRAKEVRIRPVAPTALELDGEVVEIAEVTLRVIPKAIRLCR
jgi:diacylglycerol kinase family enzyme